MKSYLLRGLVIREAPLRDHDKLLTLLTADRGKVMMSAMGVKSFHHKSMTAAQVLTYGEYTVTERNGFLSMSEGTVIDNFFGLHRQLDRFAAAQYVLDVVGEIATENNDESELLSLSLNTLYALAETDCPSVKVKAVFEMRCAVLMGISPDLSGCAKCGKEEDRHMVLSVADGCLKCGECFSDGDNAPGDEWAEYRTATVIFPLNPSILAALRYIVGCPSKKIFSFSLNDNDMAELGRISEGYLLHHIERSFHTLPFFHQTRQMIKQGETPS